MRILIAMLFVSSVASSQEDECPIHAAIELKEAQDEIQEMIAKRKAFDAERAEKVRNNPPKVGMTFEMLRENWGPPSKINTTTSIYGNSYQVIYDTRLGTRWYVYVDNTGVITTIQH